MNKLTPLPAAHGLQFARLPANRLDNAAMPEDERWLTLGDLLRIVRIHWAMILTAGAVAGAVGCVAVLLMPSIYSGSALVMIDEQQNHVFNDQTDPSVLSDLPSDPSSVESQVQMLQSPALVGQVVDRLRLTDDPEFNGSQGSFAGMATGWARNGVHVVVNGISRQLGLSPSPANSDAPSPTAAQKRREQTVRSVMGALDAEIEGRSTVIQVSFRSRSPFKAARIANAIADTYIGNLSDAKAMASQTAAKWLGDRVSQLGHQAGAADAAVQLYKAQNGLVDTSTGTALTDQKLGDLTSQLIAAEGDRAEAEAKLAQVRQLIQGGKNADVTEVVDSPLIAQLREQEATLLQQKADFSSRYGDRNPKMIALQTQLSVLNQKIDEEANRIAGTVSNGVAVASAHVQALKGDMAGATSTANTQNYARVKLGELQADAASAHALYQTYLDRLKQTQQQTSLKSTDARIISSAVMPLAPISPKSGLLIGGATLGGLVLGFLFALLADRLNGGFCSVQDLERALRLPVLATLPELGPRRSLRDIALEVVRRPHSEFSEAIRAMELSLLRHPAEAGNGKVFVIVSALPTEGKTITAVNLARRFAMEGNRVVIVDGDLRRPSVSAALGIHDAKYDLTDYLSGRCRLDEAISKDAHSPLVALSVSHGARRTNEMGAPAIATMIGRLREMTDIVIIDTPPVLAVPDAKLLAEVSDGALFVVRWSKTPREAVLRAIKSLRDFDVALLGTSLARANAKYHRYYSYGYAGLPALTQYYES